MTKEQAALRLIRIYLDTEGELEMSYELNTIETALERLDSLDKENIGLMDKNAELCIEMLRHRKQLKALEIIKEKRVNLEYIKCCDTYEQYKTICSYWNEITQKEFELLKEVLSK